MRENGERGNGREADHHSSPHRFLRNGFRWSEDGFLEVDYRALERDAQSQGATHRFSIL